MKLLAGLGNPGKQYERTRHNVGFMLIDQLLQKEEDVTEVRTAGVSALIYKSLKANTYYMKPQTFMNDSGTAVSSFIRFYKIPLKDVYIIHDDLDIKLGDYKIQKGKGPKVHNGILSIEKELNSLDFWRIRIGVDNREVGNRVKGETYILQRFTDEEIEVLEDVNKKVIADLLENYL